MAPEDIFGQLSPVLDAWIRNFCLDPDTEL